MEVGTRGRERMKRTAAIVMMLAGAGCVPTEVKYVDLETIPLPAPEDEQIAFWKSAEPWRTDPRRVAHEELRLRFEVQWTLDAFDPGAYAFFEHDPAHPDWGAYVVRGYVDRAGRQTRYRAKVARRDGIWYATEVSHYMAVALPDERFEDNR